MHDILRNAQHKQETRLDDKSLMTSNGNNGPTMFCMQAVFSSARNLRLIGARRSELQEFFRRPYLPLAPLSADALATLHGQGVRRKAVGLAPALGTSNRSRLSRDISAPIYRVVVDVGLAYILCLTFLHRKSQPFFPILAVLASPRALSQPIALPDTRPPFAIPIFLRIASALVINAAADWRYDVAGACCARLLKKKILSDTSIWPRSTRPSAIASASVLPPRTVSATSAVPKFMCVLRLALQSPAEACQPNHTKSPTPFLLATLHIRTKSNASVHGRSQQPALLAGIS